MSNQSPKDFSQLEKEAHQEMDIKSALVKAFKKLHEDQLEVFEQKLSSLEDDLKISLETHVKRQLDAQFKAVLETYQQNISSLLSPLLRKAEDNLKHLDVAVTQTNRLCDDIQKKYAFRWNRPFLLLFLSTSLCGAFVALALFLMQTSPLAVFLMDKRSREAYEHGISWLKWRQEYEAKKEVEQRATVQQPQKTQKNPKKRKRP